VDRAEDIPAQLIAHVARRVSPRDASLYLDDEAALFSQVAHVVLMEQMYRGWTILRGEPYHH